MGDNLIRFESAISATSSGNLTWERWPHDYATALGFAGQRNPLGFAVVRYLAEPPSSISLWRVVLVLATELGKRGVAEGVAREVSFQALEFWRDVRCRTCHGRGHTGPAQQPCSTCGGSGRRPLPEGSDILRDAISCLIEAEQWMEGQLAVKLKRGG